MTGSFEPAGVAGDESVVLGGLEDRLEHGVGLGAGVGGQIERPASRLFGSEPFLPLDR